MISLTLQAGGISQPVDDRLIKKIDPLVTEGVKNTNEMRRHLNVYVRNELLSKEQIQPSVSNRRFYPKLSDIRSHMYRSTVKNRFSKVDQENVAEKVHQWKNSNPGDFFYFRLYHQDVPEAAEEGNSTEEPSDTTGEEQSTLLFVHQSAWQRRLLERYGNDICLLDATYKTTRYALPLFFLVVQTNVDYQVVGSFVVQNETSQAIKEALILLKQAAPNWQPKYFMTDNCEQEISAIEEVFPGNAHLTINN